ncbi:MAG: hypothetical protein JJU00_11960 [Opitutales bacterium]|nr:hypothetical protein [Opitutales bacterium]
MDKDSAEALVEEAIFEFTMGGHDAALAKITEALAAEPNSFAAWHAKAEIHFDRRELDDALEAGNHAAALSPEDVHIHTTLSRIWMERGDKEKAEHHGARARVLGWKDQLKGNPGDSP